MSSAAPLAVLFDLDGTLVDSAPDLTAAMDHVLRAHSRPPVDRIRLAQVVSKGGRAMLQLAFPDLDELAREALLPGFLRRYAEHIADASTIYPGMSEVLQALEADGTAWGVVTNKPEALARDLLARLNLLQRCAVLVGGDTLAQRKPAPEPLWHACALLEVASSQCVYIGDDERDALAAQAAGMPAIVALWGYRTADDDPASWPAAAHCLQPADLLHLDLLGLQRVGSGLARGHG